MASPLPMTVVGPDGVAYVTNPAAADPTAVLRYVERRRALRRSMGLPYFILGVAGGLIASALVYDNAVADKASLAFALAGALAIAAVAARARRAVTQLTHQDVAPLGDDDPLALEAAVRFSDGHERLWRLARTRRAAAQARQDVRRAFEMRETYGRRTLIERSALEADMAHAVAQQEMFADAG